MPFVQSLSLQHCPGGGFISQFPPTHTMGTLGFCGHSASVVQHPGAFEQVPSLSAIAQSAPQGQTDAPRQTEPDAPQSWFDQHIPGGGASLHTPFTH